MDTCNAGALGVFFTPKRGRWFRCGLAETNYHDPGRDAHARATPESQGGLARESVRARGERLGVRCFRRGLAEEELPRSRACCTPLAFWARWKIATDEPQRAHLANKGPVEHGGLVALRSAISVEVSRRYKHPVFPQYARARPEGRVLGVIFHPQKRTVFPTWSSRRGTIAIPGGTRSVLVVIFRPKKRSVVLGNFSTLDPGLKRMCYLARNDLGRLPCRRRPSQLSVAGCFLRKPRSPC
jgi:hypothetical protein